MKTIQYTAQEFKAEAKQDGHIYTLKANGCNILVEVPAGEPFASYLLEGAEDGSITVRGSGNGDALRFGEGDGHARRGGSGDGVAYRDGDGEGVAYRDGSGNGNAYRYAIDSVVVCRR